MNFSDAELFIKWADNRREALRKMFNYAPYAMASTALSRKGSKLDNTLKAPGASKAAVGVVSDMDASRIIANNSNMSRRRALQNMAIAASGSGNIGQATRTVATKVPGHYAKMLRFVLSFFA